MKTTTQNKSGTLIETEESQKKKQLSIIVPMFNEQENIEFFISTMISILNKAPYDFEIICINDGSTDQTLLLLLQNKQKFPFIKILDLSRNFGKEAALTAGIEYAKGDAIIPIDADLQDPPELILKLISEWENGFDVVLAQRADRAADTFLKRFTSYLFYKIQNQLSDITILENAGDFRLLDKKVIAILQQLPERQRYMKGLFAWVGFNKKIISYSRSPRHAGKTKWNYWKLWNFALDGITSFSTLPIRVWTYVGICISFFAFLYATIIFIKTFIFGVDMPGYASIMITILFLNGFQFISLGILGEYIGRIYAETKQRPIYVIKEYYQ